MNQQTNNDNALRRRQRWLRDAPPGVIYQHYCSEHDDTHLCIGSTADYEYYLRNIGCPTTPTRRRRSKRRTRQHARSTGRRNK